MAEPPACPQCGVPVQETWDWCHACGYDPSGRRPGPPGLPMPPGAPPAPAPPPPGTSRGVPPAVIAALAVGVVVVLIAGFLLVGRSSGPPPAPVNAGGPVLSPGAGRAGGSVSTTSRPPAPIGDVPQEMFATPADPTVIIDEATARTVADAFWPVHVEGMLNHDAAQLATVETGAALAWDSVVCVVGCTMEFGDLIPPAFTAPPQSGYPANFLGQFRVRVSGTDLGRPFDGVNTYLVVFTRASAQDPWLATIIAGNGSAQTVLKGQPGSIVAAPPALSGDLDPRKLPQQLADYFDSYKETGVAPSDTPFRDDGNILQQAQTNAKFDGELEDLGIETETEYRSGVGEDGYYEFAADHDTIVACSTIRWRTVNVPRVPGDPITVGKGAPLPNIVPHGSYSRIERDGVREACFSFTSDCKCLNVTGLEGGSIAVRTEPPTR